MGPNVSHMNVWAIACVVRATSDDLLAILALYEKTRPGPSTTDYEVTEMHFLQILHELRVDESDREIFLDYFRILDTRSRRVVNLQQLLVALAPFVSPSLQSMFSLCFAIVDREKRLFLDKPKLVEIVKLLSQTCFYVGDKVLATELVYDLVNSVYSSAGKIDGEIFYADFTEYLAMHPVVQLFLSPQFQGPIAAKILTDEEIEASVLTEQE